MLQCEVFISESLSAIDGPRTSAVAVDEVSSLDHKVLNLQKVRA